MQRDDTEVVFTGTLEVTDDEEWSEYLKVNGMGVQGTTMSYMEAVLENAKQKQSRVFLDLMNIQRTSVEIQGKPLRPIGPSGNTVDMFA